MTCNGKNRVPPPDVLSNLPDSVIDDILMRLPLRDVVRTSILSKKWRCNWCRLPQLKLDQTLWKTSEDLISPTIGFTNILCHILTLHTRPITKFTLDIPDLNTCPNIDHLISFLSRNGIQHLVLKPPRNNLYKLPSSFFTCSQLRHLFLDHCLIRPPPLYKGFDRLISLQLIEVTISSEFLGSFICPLLEHLVLELNEDPNHIEINAPKLRSFIFIGNIKILHLKNVPLLSKVSYRPAVFFVETELDLAKIFEPIPALENFRWEHDYGQAYVFGDDYYEPVPRDAVDEIPASFSDMTFNHLKTVKITNVAGAEAELQLIKVLLANSPALVKMVINPCLIEDKTSLKVLVEITNFQRASSKAQVVYNIIMID